MDKLNHLLEEQIRELRDTAPLLRNQKELTDRIMYEIHDHRSIYLLQRKWVRLVLNTAAAGLITFFLIQTGVKEAPNVSTNGNETHYFTHESQASKLLRQTTANEALPAYLGFLQQRSRENKEFRSFRPITNTLAI